VSPNVTQTCAHPLRKKYFIILGLLLETVKCTISYSVYGAKATRSTLSTFNKVNRVEFNFAASVYRA